jgi:integrase/recombinase XerD
MIDKFVTVFIASQDIAPRSRVTYKNALARFFDWYKKEQFDSPKREVILLYKYWLDSQKLSSFTKATYLVVVKRFFSWAETEGMCQNITRGIKGIKRQLRSHQKDSLSRKYIEQLFRSIKRNSCVDCRDFAIINTLIRTGIRLKELASATQGDMQKTASGQTILYVHGKGRSGKDEFVILTEEVLQPLSEYTEKLPFSVTHETPLFVSLSDRNFGKMLTIQSLSRIIKQRLRRAKIDSKRITAHSLRHTFGVLAIQAGVSLYEVQLAMRHTASSTTQLYLGDIEKIKRLEGSPEKKIGDILKDI